MSSERIPDYGVCWAHRVIPKKYFAYRWEADSFVCVTKVNICSAEVFSGAVRNTTLTSLGVINGLDVR
jgi:hypothetical protein